MAVPPVMTASNRNGKTGVPGRIAIAVASNELMPNALGYWVNWPEMALSVDSVRPPLETIKPAAVDTINAGIWLIKPSPTVRRV